MRFLIDARLPPAFARLLRDHGHTAEHVTEVGPADDMVATGREAPAVVWIRVGNTRRAALLAWFEPLIEQIVEMVTTGSRVIELR